MIVLKGRVSKVGDGMALITIPNDTSIADILTVYDDRLSVGMPVEITVIPLKVRSAGVGLLNPSVAY